MAERVSVYLDASTMLKLHDLHKVISAGVPRGVSVSKAVAYAIIQAHAAEFTLSIPPVTDEELEVISKYLSGGKYGDDGGGK